MHVFITMTVIIIRIIDHDIDFNIIIIHIKMRITMSWYTVIRKTLIYYYCFYQYSYFYVIDHFDFNYLSYQHFFYYDYSNDVDYWLVIDVDYWLVIDVDYWLRS